MIKNKIGKLPITTFLFQRKAAQKKIKRWFEWKILKV